MVCYRPKSSVLPLKILQSVEHLEHLHRDLLVFLNHLPSAVLTLEGEEGGLESHRSV